MAAWEQQQQQQRQQKIKNKKDSIFLFSFRFFFCRLPVAPFSERPWAVRWLSFGLLVRSALGVRINYDLVNLSRHLNGAIGRYSKKKKTLKEEEEEEEKVPPSVKNTKQNPKQKRARQILFQLTHRRPSLDSHLKRTVDKNLRHGSQASLFVGLAADRGKRSRDETPLASVWRWIISIGLLYEGKFRSFRAWRSKELAKFFGSFLLCRPSCSVLFFFPFDGKNSNAVSSNVRLFASKVVSHRNDSHQSKKRTIV